MTVETYFTMNAQIVAILRQGSDPMALYAAQRIEELERIAGVRGECLEIAMKALRQYAATILGAPSYAESMLVGIKARLAMLEQENIPNGNELDES